MTWAGACSLLQSVSVVVKGELAQGTASLKSWVMSGWLVQFVTIYCRPYYPLHPWSQKLSRGGPGWDLWMGGQWYTEIKVIYKSPAWTATPQLSIFSQTHTQFFFLNLGYEVIEQKCVRTMKSSFRGERSAWKVGRSHYFYIWSIM